MRALVYLCVLVWRAGGLWFGRCLTVGGTAGCDEPHFSKNIYAPVCRCRFAFASGGCRGCVICRFRGMLPPNRHVRFVCMEEDVFWNAFVVASRPKQTHFLIATSSEHTSCLVHDWEAILGRFLSKQLLLRRFLFVCGLAVPGILACPFLKPTIP